MGKFQNRRKRDERVRLFKFHKKLTKYVGVGMFKITQTGDYDNFPHRQYRIYSIAILGLVLLLFIALEMLELLRITCDFERLSFQMSLIPSQILNLIKAISMLYYHRRLISIITVLEKSASNLYVTDRHVITTDRKCLFLTKFYTIVLVLCVLYFAIPSLRILHDKNNYFSGNTTVTSTFLKSKLPVSIYLPFEINNTLSFSVAMLYQMFILMYQSFLVCTNDCFAASILMHLSCQFVTVQEMMKNIYPNAIAFLQFRWLERSKNNSDVYRNKKVSYGDFDKEKFVIQINKKASEVSENKEAVEGISFPTFSIDEVSDSMEIFLIDAIKLHESTIRCVKEYEYIFRHGLFGQIVTSVIVICLSFYPLVGMKEADMIKLVGGALMMMVFMPQLALLTWNCTNIATEADEVASVAYCCPWYLGNAKFRKTLEISIASAQRDQVIKACSGLIPLSNETFVDLVTRSYSAFAIVMSFQKQQ